MPTNLRHTRLGGRIGQLYAATGGTPAPGSGASPLLTDLVSYWKLDEASGTATDAQGTNHLTDVNTVTSAAGKQGTSRQFTKVNTEYFSLASNASLQTGDIDFTVACWVYIDSLSAVQQIFAKDGSTGGQREYNLEYHGGVTRFRFVLFRATDSAVLAVADSLGAPSAATWYFVVAWHDAAADTVNIQVNNGTVDSVATGGALQAASNGDFNIGRRNYPAFEDTFDGRLDEMALWKRTLSAAERTQLWAGGAGVSYPTFT